MISDVNAVQTPDSDRLSDTQKPDQDAGGIDTASKADATAQEYLEVLSVIATPAQLALIFGCHIRTIKRYLTGEAQVPATLERTLRAVQFINTDAKGIIQVQFVDQA